MGQARGQTGAVEHCPYHLQRSSRLLASLWLWEQVLCSYLPTWWHQHLGALLQSSSVDTRALFVCACVHICTCTHSLLQTIQMFGTVFFHWFEKSFSKQQHWVRGFAFLASSFRRWWPGNSKVTRLSLCTFSQAPVFIPKFFNIQQLQNFVSWFQPCVHSPFAVSEQQAYYSCDI